MCSRRTESRLPLGTRYAVAVPTLTRSSGSSRTGVNPKAYEREITSQRRLPFSRDRGPHSCAAESRSRRTCPRPLRMPHCLRAEPAKRQQLQKSPSPPTLRRRAASAGWGLPCISETGGGGCPCPASVVPELRGRAGASWGLQARAGWGSSREAPESPWVAAFLATEMHIFGVT